MDGCGVQDSESLKQRRTGQHLEHTEDICIHSNSESRAQTTSTKSTAREHANLFTRSQRARDYSVTNLQVNKITHVFNSPALRLILRK